MTPAKSAADYAAVAVAPLLIFIMISSLANFLMLILYHGGYPQRVSWTLLMYTLGAVGIARVAIEQSRSYSYGYAGVLGIAAFTVMLGLVNSPIFSLFILVVIAYLADVIVRDCTLIDDDVDASGQGLFDSGRLFVKSQIRRQNSSLSDDDDEDREQGETHQPGRTVMYLALGALPLFGLGQFFLHNDTDTWARAQKLLAFYLFSSLSLLVTTSFLGLRRYLRQRHAEMPKDVSISWLAGGLALIAAVLTVAYVAPMPGKALASFELPELLDSPGNRSASRYGWGDEGADKSDPNAPGTLDRNAEDKEVQGMTQQSGAPAGDVGDGNRSDGPAGQQKGGKKQSSGDGGPKSESESSGDKSSSSQGGESGDNEKQNSSSQESSQQNSAENSTSRGDQESSQSSSDQSGDQSKDDSNGQGDQSRPGESGQESKSDPQSGESSSDENAQRQEDSDRAESPQEQRENTQREQSDSESQSQQSSGTPPKGESESSSSPSRSVTESIAEAMPMVAGFVKFIVFLVLFGIVAAFLWMHRDMIAQWWDSLFNRGSGTTEETFDEFLEAVTQVPPRAFASFTNPIGKESDLRRIVVITFQAFEAWTRERGLARGRDETPNEFIRRASTTVPQLSAPASQVVEAYNRIAYGRGKATENDLNAARQVWSLMHSSG